MANNINTTLQRDALMNGALMALREGVPALNLFSTAMVSEPLLGTDKIAVAYHPLNTAASQDFDPAVGYGVSTSTQTDVRDVTINKRKFQDLSFTSKELMRQPNLDPEVKGLRAGQKLTEDVFGDILSQVLAANYAQQSGPFAANAFFADDIQDLDTKADELGWMRSGRGLILGHAYEGNVIKDAKVHQDAYGPNNAIRDARLPTIGNFSIAATGHIPENGENLVGLATYESAMLVGFAPISPADSSDTLIYETMTDPDGSGITIEYREWFDRTLDTKKCFLECNYGYGIGEADALIRLIKA